MNGRVGRTGGARAVVAIVALYGLFLQAFLAGMLPAAAALGPDGASICAPAEGAGSDRGGGKPLRHDCCTAASLGSWTVLPDTTSASIAWPASQPIRVVWTAADAILSTGPPVYAESARGPPSA